jgi:hypothetical protein
MLVRLLSGTPAEGGLRGGRGAQSAITDPAELQEALRTSYARLQHAIAGVSDAELMTAAIFQVAANGQLQNSVPKTRHKIYCHQSTVVSGGNRVGATPAPNGGRKWCTGRISGLPNSKPRSLIACAKMGANAS